MTPTDGFTSDEALLVFARTAPLEQLQEQLLSLPVQQRRASGPRLSLQEWCRALGAPFTGRAKDVLQQQLQVYIEENLGRRGIVPAEGADDHLQPPTNLPSSSSHREESQLQHTSRGLGATAAAGFTSDEALLEFLGATPLEQLQAQLRDLPLKERSASRPRLSLQEWCGALDVPSKGVAKELLQQPLLDAIFRNILQRQCRRRDQELQSLHALSSKRCKALWSGP